MENNRNDIDWIERYLDRSLSVDERRAMEKRLKEEPDLNSQYIEYGRLIQGIRYAHLRDKLEQLQTLEHHLPEIEIGKEVKMNWIRVNWKPMALAAGLLLIATSYLIFYNRTPSNEKLFTSYYEPFDSPGTGLTRGQNDGTLTLKQKGYQSYDQGKYEAATSNFEKVLKEDHDPIVQLCLGNAYLLLGLPEKAESVFQSMLKDNNDLVTQAKWYLALALLKQNKPERVRTTLSEISKSSTYGEKARKLLKELD